MPTNDKNRNMQVVLRVRPLNARELEQNQRNIIRVADANTIIFDPDDDEDEFFFHGTKQTHRDITKRVNKKLTMLFDRVFDDASSNADVFEQSMKPLVSSVMGGFNCSAFVYGATGAGKTHTMLGSEENPGITYLTMKELFEQIEGHSGERKFDIGISYLEVYNEQVMNLLTKTGPLRLRDGPNGITMISGLELKPIYDADELLSLLALGNRNRTQHPTDANAESSRSHAIFQVHIRMTNKSTGQKRTVKLSMIDLAGSERGSSTKCVGQRFKEGASINKSLLALGNCINKLADGSKHIPYRDSNMTRILKDSLGGNCQTVMIANISPSALTYEDTYNTLKYASRAQKIRTSSLTQNAFKTNLPKEFYVHKLTETMAEVEHLNARIKIIESQAATQNGQDNDKFVAFDRLIADMVEWREKIDRIYVELKVAQESYFNLYSKEKVLHLRTKLKGQTEQIKKMFTMNGEHLPKDLSRVEASIGKFAKQIEISRIEKERWLQRFKDTKGELIRLTKGITDERMKVMLEPYLKCKRIELEKAATECRSEHHYKIIRIYSAEMECSTKAVHLSGEIMQDTYYLLKANYLLTNEMDGKMNQLAKLHDGQRGVRFANGPDDASNKHDHDDDDIPHAQSIDDITLDASLDLMSTDADEAIFAIPARPLQSNHAKRALIVEDGESVSKRFAAAEPSPLNATRVLESHSDGEENSHSGRPVIKVIDRIVSRRPIASSRALKETNTNVNKNPSGKAPIRALVNGRMITLKENQNKTVRMTPSKRPPRIRNSPGASAKMLGARMTAKPTSTDAMLKRLKGNPILTKPLPK